MFTASFSAMHFALALFSSVLAFTVRWDLVATIFHVSRKTG